MTRHGARTWLVIATAGYFVVAFAIGFWPTRVDAGADGQIFAVLRAVHRLGAPAWLDYGVIEFTANIVFFLPFGFLVCLLLPRALWPLAIIAGFLGSSAIEWGQLAFRPERVASWGDILSNTIGAVIGTLIAVFIRDLAKRRRARRAQPANSAAALR